MGILHAIFLLGKDGKRKNPAVFDEKRIFLISFMELVSGMEGVSWGFPEGCERVARGLGGVQPSEPSPDPLGGLSDSTLYLKRKED